MKRLKLLSFRSQTIVGLAIALLLWLNSAYLHHQYDFSVSHHTEHHCQLFASGLHGASTYVPSLIVVPTEHIIGSLVRYHFSPIWVSAYLARSPPILNHKSAQIKLSPSSQDEAIYLDNI